MNDFISEYLQKFHFILEYLQKFNEADLLHSSLVQQCIDVARSGVLVNIKDWESLKAQIVEAKEVRDDYALIACRLLIDCNFCDLAPADITGKEER